MLSSAAEPGVRPLPPLVLQAGHVGEVGTRGEHVASMGRVGNFWEGSRSEDTEILSRAVPTPCPKPLAAQGDCGLVEQVLSSVESPTNQKVGCSNHPGRTEK